MFNKFLAWYELLKLGNIKKVKVQNAKFFRGNIIKVVKREGWFEFLDEPHSAEELAEYCGYTDIKFLQEILDIMAADGTLRKTEGNKYQTARPIDESWVLPEIFTEAWTDIWQSYANKLPERLRGSYVKFTGGFNVFNWDDVLALKAYETTRRAAFAFSGAWNKPGKFLDVGCGNGWGTSAIWSYYYKRKHIRENSPLEIHGIDIDENLLNIAQEEFPRMVARHLDLSENQAREIIAKYSQFIPQYQHGSATEIPFPDETFDYVYASHVLHWTDAKTALHEMIRVTKLGGIIFGPQVSLPFLNPYVTIHVKIVSNAGVFHKDKIKEWALECGVRKVEIATPIVIYKIIK